MSWNTTVLIGAAAIALGGAPVLSGTSSRSPLPASEAKVLPAVLRAQISATIGRDQPAYHAVTTARGYRMIDASRSVSAELTAEGVDFRQGNSHLAMALRGYGYGATLRDARAVAPTAEVNRVEYRRDGLTEWYVNGPFGLEQGFTLDRAFDNATGEPVTLALSISGNLGVSVDPGARSATLKMNGAAALRYTGLSAWDATGRELPTWLEKEGNDLRVRVNDAGARYPVTIDPYVQGVKLTQAVPCSVGQTCDEGHWGSRFGFSVAMSADGSTVAVGVPYQYVSGVRAGLVYVFLKPPDFVGGWMPFQPMYYTTKLFAGDFETAGLQLGWSVDVSRDGGTIVVGARGDIDEWTPPSGAAYVFVRPASGWSGLLFRRHNAKLSVTTPTNVNNNGSVGKSVTISGDGGTIVVGAPNQQVDGIYKGAAYVYFRPSTGWTSAYESQKLGGTRNSSFGTSVDLSDDGMILVEGEVGTAAFGEPDFSGVAGVFRRGVNGGSFYGWVARLYASDLRASDYFGYSVSANGDGSVIVVGKPVGGWYGAGAAYVFERPAAGWGDPTYVTEAAKLTSSDGYTWDSFGASVSISLDGKTILVGAMQRGLFDYQPSGHGAAYFFGRPFAGWSSSTETKKVIPSDLEYDDQLFGFSTALSGDGTVAVIGEPFGEIGNNLYQGAAYVFVGSAAEPSASLSPSSLTYAVQPVGTSSAPQTVTLTNSGTAPLHVTSVVVSPSFTSTQNCVSASPLAPGASCWESVAFAPAFVGQITGTLTFTDDSGGTSGSTQEVQLQGTGQTATTMTSIVSVSANTVLVGQPLTVSFAVAPQPGNTLTPSGSVTVQASTGESCTGSAPSGSCNLTFSSAVDRTITATYSGDANFETSTSAATSLRVVDFSVAVSPASQSISGRKATYTVALAALNGFAGTVSLSCGGGPANTTCAMVPAAITFPGSTTSAKATVTVAVGAPRGTYAITFTGKAGSVTRSMTASLTLK